MKTYPKTIATIAMKSIILFSILSFAGFTAKAQKFAYVDTDYILEHIPEYNSAQATLDNLTVQWQKEIEAKFAEIEKMYKTYQTESVLLPEEMKRKREDEIIKKEKEVKDLQQKRFGKEGDLTKKREELIKPIQEKIYTALQEIANQGNYAVIFDKAGSLSMVYTNPRFDISEEVLTKMGYSY
ncbi:MAG: OmpH family outer membrane protein [Bacteroidales bacterium]|nr:OmpH family outer membrane protein [Bacteroidales bacterium]MDZ4204586.1 OmpH family outer membrane protein [Bacteroidales bacterium]